MKRTLIAAALLLLGASYVQAQDHQTPPETLDSTVVSAFRAGAGTPVAYSDLNREELQSASTLQSLPMTLGLQPSVVTTNEGGTGLGYSKMRLRGSDATRINVTINGITLNDAESQEVFWVNIPGISGMLNSVQLQRGIGTSVNGPGAFGGSINMQTMLPHSNPYTTVELSGGSWYTGIGTIATGTGRTDNGFSADIRYSYNTTEGYLDNAWARLHSVFATVDYMGENNSLKFNYILGSQHSGITWEGCPPEMLETNRRYNPTVCKGQIEGYKGDSDNYLQQHIQGIYSHQVTSNFIWTTTLHFTDGMGYYENYKSKNKETGEKGDFKLRQAMDNRFYAGNTNFKWNSPKLAAVLNFAYSIYNGSHNGYYLPFEGSRDDDYYYNTGKKRDFSTFLRAEWKGIKRLNIYGDIQFRQVRTRIEGPDKDHVALDYKKTNSFFNPKGGLSLSLTKSASLYGSVAFGHKEPSRSDIKEAIKAGREEEIKPEKMVDCEFGYTFDNGLFALAANCYLMEYRDQLLETGLLSETGYSIKQNVARSYRRGIELSAAAQPVKWLKLEGNATLSRNRILGYKTYVDIYDNPEDWNFIGQKEEYYEETDMLLSPSLIGMAALTLKPVKALELKAAWKYVGKQYWDNTSCDERSLKAYDVFSAQAHCRITQWLKISLFAENLLSRQYEADAWVYRAVFQNGDTYTSAGLFPQAPFSLIGKVTITI
ncbi:MAG: TonB-dependent receptor [Bacteroidales bacterium]|nr:TonB-dependent receptor [Bacteroidales bacterium]MBR5056103.1 TonB-dependent receptor [Bacteroidales bacterium]